MQIIQIIVLKDFKALETGMVDVVATEPPEAFLPGCCVSVPYLLENGWRPEPHPTTDRLVIYKKQVN